MQGRNIFGRFGPLFGVVAIQLLIIAVAPSEAPSTQQAAATGQPGATGDLTGGTAYDPSAGSDPSGGAVSGGSSGGSGGTGTSTGSGSTGTGGTGGGGTGRGNGGTTTASGDTSHCVGGRQFDPAIDYYAPPCVPKFTGQNTGASYQGVTGDTINIVRYYGKGSPAVDAILQAQDAYVSPDQHRDWLAKAQKFINDHYELYGRKVKITVVEGTCDTIPPKNDCLRNEMREIVEDHQPYFIWWNTSLSSAAFDELSKLRTPNAGGWHFRDDFFQLRRPYHWDIQMSGTRVAQHVGRWYCQQLSGKKAQYANQDSLKARDRLLGVIATNDPENQATVEVDLKAELDKCGASFGDRTYFYAQDISTADQQRRAAVLKMRGDALNANDDSTSVMCFCDLVAPVFLYQEEQTQSYYPENIVVGTGFMDTDPASQPYTGSLGCSDPTKPCAFEGAFGLTSLSNPPEKKNADTGTRVWQAGGGKGEPPFDSGTVTIEWDYLNLIATLIQAAGPDLTPANMEAGAFKIAPRGDANHAMRFFSPGNYAWNQDMAVVYWANEQPSPYNGEPGRYVRVTDRIPVDGWKPGDLSLPPMPR